MVGYVFYICNLPAYGRLAGVKEMKSLQNQNRRVI